MAIQRLDKVFCSLNLGLIYDLSYSYSPENGVNISLSFINESGEYTPPNLLPMQKASIRVGRASFSMYPKQWKLTKAAGRRVIKVEFVDETRELDNYYIAMTGRGCGTNIYQLGNPVDNRTAAQKFAAAIAPDAQTIKDFTQFQDLEYGFNDFLAILRRRFNVQILAFFDTSVTNAYYGTFAEALRSWMSFYNLSFFFENGILKVFDPTKLTINLPDKPVGAIDYDVEEDISSTYGTTVSNYFQQNGGEFSLAQTSGDKGALLVREAALYPAGYAINLSQTTFDLNQVVAAMYGREFWFLYNKYKGSTAAECGWTPLDFVPGTLNTSLVTLGFRAATVNDNVYEAKYEAYRAYGEKLGGRWYLSDERAGIALDQNYRWFNQTDGPIVSFINVSDKQINPGFLTPPDTKVNVIEGTQVNQYFPGINYQGQRMVYYDERKIDFAVELGLTPALMGLIAQTYQNLFALPGSSSLAFQTDKHYVAYNSFAPIPQDIQLMFNNLSDKFSLFQPRYKVVNLVGISSADYANQQAAQNENDNVEVVTDAGPTVVGNTSVMKTVKNGSYTAYYNKFSDCASAASAGTYFKHEFNLRQISDDNEVGFTFTKLANNTYRIDRDYGLVKSLVNNPLLPTIAQARTFATRRVSFSLNAFYDIPVNFLSNGLVGMDMQMSSNGLSASYSFSNEILQVPRHEKAFNALEQQIRNSWIRSYRPKETIS